MTSVCSRYWVDLRSAGLFLGLALLSGGVVSGQCYQQSLGALLGHGDDDPLYASRPIGFVFPFAGSTYTDVHVSNNGVVYLSNGGTPAPGTASGYSDQPSTMVANLFTGPPTIAACWKDLDNGPGAGVFVDSQSTRCVVTWKDTVEFLRTTPKTIQIQLSPNGEILVSYSTGFALESGIALCGLTPGALADPGMRDLSAQGSTSGGAAYEVFDATGNPFDLGGKAVRWQPSGAGWTITTSVCDPALHREYGLGCGGSARAFYEVFETPNSIDLSGKTIRCVQNQNGGYDVSVQPLTSFVMPTGIGLGLGDDMITQGGGVFFGFSWDYPGGSVSNVPVDSNGRILINGFHGPDPSDYTPSVADLIDGGFHQISAPHCDFVPDGATNIDNVFFETNGTTEARLTWRNVACFQSNQRSTFQVVFFHTAAPGGDGFELRYQSIVNDSAFDSTAVVGFATGPNSRDSGSRDLTLLPPFSTRTDSFDDLRLSAAPAPVLGSTMTFTASQLRPGFAAIVVGFASVVPGYELQPFAPRCYAHLLASGNEIVLGLGSGPTAALSLVIPNDLSMAGLSYYGQTLNLVPGANPLGVLTSNAVEGRLRTY